MAKKINPRAESNGSAEVEEPAIYDEEILNKFNKLTEDKSKIIAGQKPESGNYVGVRNDHLIRVTAYGFRGDTRAPVHIKADGGFHPNATRDDRRRIAELPAGSTERPVIGKTTTINPVTTDDLLDNMVHQASWGSDYSGFVSFAKNPAKTLQFIKMALGSGTAEGYGWIYVVKCRDAIDVSQSFQNPRYQEDEISVAGGVEWQDVVGWRKVLFKRQKSGRPEFSWADKTIYLSDNEIKLPKLPSLPDGENKFEKILEVLSTDMNVLQYRKPKP